MTEIKMNTIETKLADLVRDKYTRPNLDALVKANNNAPELTEVLDAAKAAMLQRANEYGALEDNFSRITRLWRVHFLNRYGLDIVLDEIDVAFMLQDLKKARLQGNPYHRDSWVDNAGYAACGGELAARARPAA
jgi:hypothetical protein